MSNLGPIIQLLPPIPKLWAIFVWVNYFLVGFVIWLKGRKDDSSRSLQDLTSTKSTTFSGYLLRKKGPNWKNRWCVVREHWLFCYKDFGVGIAELEIPLHDTSIKAVEHNYAERPHMFVLICQREELYFAAENEAELEEWLLVLKDEIEAIESSTSKFSFLFFSERSKHLLTTLKP